MPERAVARQTHLTIDVALGIFHDLLPEYGFKLVMPPPPITGGPSHAFASAWRRGDAQAVSCSGTTPALALLRAAESELVKLRNASGPGACIRCRGLGWFVTIEGTIEMCRHAESHFDVASASPSP